MPKMVDYQKDALIAGLSEARQKILASILKLSPEQKNEAFLGDWTVKDLVAHLIGWDVTNLEAVQEIMKGQYPSFFKFYDKDWHSYNDRLVQKYKKERLEDLLVDVNSSHRQLIHFLEAIPPNEMLNGKAKSEKGRTISIRFLLSSEAGDERQHAEQVLAFAARGTQVPPQAG
jgi:hypothetical protein